MSGLLDICTGVHSTGGHSESYLTCLFVMVDFFPVYLFVLIWSIYISTGSLFYYSLGISVTIDKLLNLLLRQIFKSTHRHDTYQFPALSSQLSAFIVTMLVLMVMLYRVRVTMYRAFLGSVFLVLAIYSRIYLDASSQGQILGGIIVGFCDAVVQSTFIFYIVYRHQETIINSWVGYIMGLRNVFMFHRSLVNPDRDMIKAENIAKQNGYSSVSELRTFLEKAEEQERNEYGSIFDT